MKITITVIVVVMNETDSLDLTLKSLLESKDLIDTVIVKDGSLVRLISDYEIQSQYAGLNVLYKHGADSGIYDAMNQGILASPSCDYLWFLNAGDTLSSRDSLVHAIESIEMYGDLPDICLFGWKVGGKVVRPWWLKSVMTTKFRAHYSWIVRHQSVWFKYSIAVKQLYDTTYKIVADSKLIASILLKKNSLVYINQDIILTHNDASGVCKTQIIEKENEFKRMLYDMNTNIFYKVLVYYRVLIRKFFFYFLRK